MRLGYFDPENTYSKLGLDSINTQEHQQLALEAARRSLVLLKNDQDSLPFSSMKSIALTGPNADNEDVLLGNYAGIPPYKISLLKGLQQFVPNVLYSPGCDIDSNTTDGIPKV